MITHVFDLGKFIQAEENAAYVILSIKPTELR